MSKASHLSAGEFNHRAFWLLFSERHHAEEKRRALKSSWYWQRHLPQFEVVITMYVAPEQDLVGVFFGRNENLGAIAVPERLRPYQIELLQVLRLTPEQRQNSADIISVWHVNCFAEDNWPAMSDWLVTEASRFEQAVVAILKDQ